MSIRKNGQIIAGKGDALPTQVGQSGKYLTTDGTSLLWNTVDALPSQTGQSGKFLTTDGTNPSWAEVDALPSQTGQSGKFLTTDGSNASWTEIQSVPPTDNETINLNADEELQVIGVIDAQDNSTPLKTWTGTKAQYDAIATKDEDTLYNVTDDHAISLSLLQTIYPVGSLYLTLNDTCPLAMFFGTWQMVGQDKVLQGAGIRGVAGDTLNESLPNIKGKFIPWCYGNGGTEGVFSSSGEGTASSWGTQDVYHGSIIDFNASRSSSTYQDNAPVQPDALLVNIFRRIL